jgi:hypothetical protein
VARIDYQREKDLLWARYVFDDTESRVPFLSTTVPGFDGLVNSRNQLFVLSEVHTFGPNLFNEFRASFNRLVFCYISK